jgi:hypothetical protein
MNLKTSPQRRKGAKIAKEERVASFSPFTLQVSDVGNFINDQVVDFLCGTLRSLRLCGE